jgi:hypothetical protein
VTPKAQHWWLQTALPGAGLLALVAGVDRDWPRLADAGLLLLAAAGITAGGVTLALRRLVFLARTRRFVLRVWTGPGAVFAGVGLIVVGLMAGAVGVLHWAGTSAAGLKALVVSRPGLLLAPAGAAFSCQGLALLIGFPEARDPRGGGLWNALLSVPGRLGGLILLVLGAGALALGSWEILSPAAFDRAVASLAGG